MSNKSTVPFLSTNISTDVTILTKPGVFHGFCLIPASTGAVKAVAYDASATAQGTVVFVASVASTVGLVNAQRLVEAGIVCRAGLHIDVSCTSGADQVIVYYSVIN